MYVKDIGVKVMDEKTLEKKDYSIGQEFEVKKNTANANRIGFSNTIFGVGEKVYVISAKERNSLIQQLNQRDEYKARIEELEADINDEDLKGELQEKDAMIANLKARVDNLGKELEESKAQPKVYDKDEVEELKEELKAARGQEEYWHNAYNNLIDSSDGLAARNEELIKENEKLKTTNDNINQTNQLLNDNLMSVNQNYKESKDELQADFDAKEKDLKETIEKQQAHIDELMEKVQSLSILKDYISPKEHYAALEELKDKIKEVEKELDKAKAEVDLKLATQKSEIDIKHTEEKAQMLLAYSQELNAHKLKYNELAKDYNHLLGDASSLSRINTLFSGRHKTIVKDKEPVELEEIEVEKEPTETIEYVPKDEITLI